MKTSEKLEAVRERELYSKEIGFINYTKKLIRIDGKNLKYIKGGLYARIGI